LIKVHIQWMFWFSMGIGCIFVWLTADRIYFLLRSEKTNGKVVEMFAQNVIRSSRFNNNCITLFTARVKFHSGDKTPQRECFLDIRAGSASDYNRPISLAKYKVGDTVPIRFDPYHPEQCWKKGNEWSAPLVALIFCTITFLVSLLKPKDPMEKYYYHPKN